jgi:GNAT superfamily N-acetyltransferase
MRAEHRVGLDYLTTATALLQRVRRAHPTAGLYEAADLQWWWRTPRDTDDLAQLFWFDDAGRPVAAAIAIDWAGRVALVPVVMPDASPDHVARVIEHGLAHLRASGFDAVDVDTDRADTVMRDALAGHGFTVESDEIAETWIATDARPPVSPLADGYRLGTRLDTGSRAHHFIERSGPDVETRLRQTSLYRPDLDLLVRDERDDVVAYGLFWFDPATATGLVEPMRTEQAHQRRGLARHILTTGIDRLAGAGAVRVKICFEPGNPAARDLYLGVGFEPDRRTVVRSRA